MLYRMIFLIPLVLATGTQAQSSILTCQPSAVPATVRSEGIAERTGDIVLSCSGGQSGASVSGNVIVSLNVNVTNRVRSDGTTDVTLAADNGSGVTTFAARPYSANSVAFNGVTFTLSAQGQAELRIVNLRGDASQLGLANSNPVTASVSLTGAGLAVTGSTFVVAVPQRGLLSTSTGRLICDQYGSPLPATIDFADLLAASAFSTTRVTEGFASAFAPLSDPSNLRADSGVRIMARYSGFTNGARLFVPDAVAGIDADIATSAGDMGSPASGGQYTPGKGELLLIRVLGTDANGAGGTLAMPAPAAQTAFNSVSEAPLTGGFGVVVYEVVDANPFVRESAQFPTFLGLPPNSGASAVETNFSISLAPVSTTITQTQTAPIPRFVETEPPTDCPALNDCNAKYFPALNLDTTPIQLSSPVGQPATHYIPIQNGGSGVLQWSATVTYGPGASNYLTLTPSAGVNNGTIRVDAVTTGLAPGTYNAAILIDAGPLVGTRAIPVTLTVTASGAVTGQTPAIASLSNAASSAQTTLVAGSLATIMGAHFSGSALQVTFDGTSANVIFSNGQQINLLVPAALAGKSTSSVVVWVGGNASAPMTANLAVAAPAIFPGAVLNQDYGVNGPSAPAQTGSVVQVFATGLPAAGIITAQIHDRLVPVPQYGGPAPGLPGVQQVNILVPPDLPTMQTWVYVCGGATADQQVCSDPEKIWIAQ
jgi:uncharacterized protein (TIGR03437 family)